MYSIKISVDWVYYLVTATVTTPMGCPLTDDLVIIFIPPAGWEPHAHEPVALPCNIW